MANTYKMPSIERETHIIFNAEQDTAFIETFDPTQIRKFDKLVAKAPDFYRLVSKEDYLGNTRARYEIADKTFLSFKTKVKTMTMSDEQKRANAEGLARARRAACSECQDSAL